MFLRENLFSVFLVFSESNLSYLDLFFRAGCAWELFSLDKDRLEQKVTSTNVIDFLQIHFSHIISLEKYWFTRLHITHTSTSYCPRTCPPSCHWVPQSFFSSHLLPPFNVFGKRWKIMQSKQKPEYSFNVPGPVQQRIAKASVVFFTLCFLSPTSKSDHLIFILLLLTDLI